MSINVQFIEKEIRTKDGGVIKIMVPKDKDEPQGRNS